MKIGIIFCLFIIINSSQLIAEDVADIDPYDSSAQGSYQTDFLPQIQNLDKPLSIGERVRRQQEAVENLQNIMKEEAEELKNSKLREAAGDDNVLPKMPEGKSVNILVKSNTSDVDAMMDNIRSIVANDQETIIIVPIEGVLFTPINKEFFVVDPNYKAIKEKALSSVNRSKLSFLNELMFIKYKHKPLDVRLVKFVSEMIEKGVKIIVLTSNTTGGFDNYDHLEVKTIDWLKENGISLNDSIYKNTKFYMNGYFKKRKGTYPSFYKGLLSANEDGEYNSVSSVIATFLVMTKEKSSKVIMLHSNPNIIKYTADAIKMINRGSLFWGYHIKNNIEDIFPQNYTENISPEEYSKFWRKISDGLNKVKTGFAIKSNDPYEEK